MIVGTLSDEAFATIEPEVVKRAMELNVTRMSKGVFYVWGGYEPHWVNLLDPQMPRCDCIDHEARNRVCKHLVLALLEVGDFRVWRRLRELDSAARLPDVVWERYGTGDRRTTKERRRGPPLS